MAISNAQLINAFPDAAKFSQRVSLGNRTWTITATWRPRIEAWFVDLFDEEGGAIFYHRRLSPNSDLAFGRLDFSGKLWCVGDDSRQENFGPHLHLFYIELDDD